MKTKAPKKLVAFRLAPFAVNALEKAAIESGLTKTEIVERAIPLHLCMMLYAKGDTASLYTVLSTLKMQEMAQNGV